MPDGVRGQHVAIDDARVFVRRWQAGERCGRCADRAAAWFARFGRAMARFPPASCRGRCTRSHRLRPPRLRWIQRDARTGHVPHRECEAGVVGLVRDFLGAAAQAGW